MNVYFYDKTFNWWRVHPAVQETTEKRNHGETGLISQALDLDADGGQV